MTRWINKYFSLSGPHYCSHGKSSFSYWPIQQIWFKPASQELDSREFNCRQVTGSWLCTKPAIPEFGWLNHSRSRVWYRSRFCLVTIPRKVCYPRWSVVPHWFPHLSGCWSRVCITTHVISRVAARCWWPWMPWATIQGNRSQGFAFQPRVVIDIMSLSSLFPASLLGEIIGKGDKNPCCQLPRLIWTISYESGEFFTTCS